MPKVSVIVPNYNHAKFLGKRLDSVLSQSYRDFELIFLDDASTDDSLAVFKSHTAGVPVRTVVNECNSGSPFVQWNRGIDLASGEYVWIAESDDFADPAFLELLVGELERNPSAGLAYCQSWIWRETTGKQRKADWYEPFSDAGRWRKPYRNHGRDEVRDYLSFKNIIPNASSVVFRRSVVGDQLRASEQLILCGDWKFWVDILLRSDIIYRSETLNYFRMPHTVSQRSQTARQGMAILEGLDVYCHIRDNVQLDEDIRLRIFDHQLWQWASMSSAFRFDRSVDRLIRTRLESVFGEEITRHSRLASRLAYYYNLRVPLKKNLLYKNTIGRIGHWYANRPGRAN